MDVCALDTFDCDVTGRKVLSRGAGISHLSLALKSADVDRRSGLMGICVVLIQLDRELFFEVLVVEVFRGLYGRRSSSITMRLVCQWRAWGREYRPRGLSYPSASDVGSGGAEDAEVDAGQLLSVEGETETAYVLPLFT